MDGKDLAARLQTRKLFLATPMYGGMCSGLYTRGIAELARLCARYGIGLDLHFLVSESLITRARNYCADAFLRSQATHLMFIDSDIGFSAQDVLTMLALVDDDSEYDVLAGTYPKKRIAWDQVKTAVEHGLGDTNPNDLARYGADYVVNFHGRAPDAGVMDRPIEVREAGTGFMLIRRRTFETYAKAFPEKSYLPDHVEQEHFDGSREIMMYFQAAIHPESRRYLSEDYLFCDDCQRIGLKIWLCPWIQLQHVGSYSFSGSLTDQARLREPRA